MPEFFREATLSEPAVRGFLHEAGSTTGLVITHSAGSNCKSPLLVSLAEVLAAHGVTVLRCDLPFRQARPYGPPLGTAEKDQAGLRRAVHTMREIVNGRIFLGGHSYGGRMASMLAAQEPSLVEGLVLLSYPLHPPRKPQQMRTAHFPKLETPALFVHGTRDPFGSVEEMKSALNLVPAKTQLLAIDGSGHELVGKTNRQPTIDLISQSFLDWSGALNC